MKTLTKIEYEKITLSDCPSGKQFKELHDFSLSEKGRKILTPGHGYVKTTSHVGVIQTKSGFILEILPKTYKSTGEAEAVEIIRNQFTRMLRAIRHLPKHKDIDFANLKDVDMPIYEIFISMFISEIQQIIKKGIKSSYVAFNENLTFLRGKLVVGEHIKRNMVHKEQFFVSYDEYIQDIPMNRIIKTALNFIKRITSSNQNYQKINELLFIFDDVCFTTNSDDEFSKIHHDRSIDYYNRALAWAMLFLKSKSFTTYSGSSIAFALLFPMEKVFESYVFQYLKKYSDLQDIRTQSSQYYLANEKGANIFLIKPDIIARNPSKNVRYIIDVKWKIIDESDKESKYGVSQSDMYQMLSYAKIFESNEKTKIKVRLFYPKTNRFNDLKAFNFNDVAVGSAGIELKIIPFDIEKSLNYTKYGFLFNTNGASIY